MTASNKGGRPLKFKSPEELQEKVDEYFKWVEDKKKYPTISGLAYYLDTTRKTLLEYENCFENDRLSSVDDNTKVKFINTIKRAKARIEMEYEESLFYKNSSVGAIFTLKNNFGWVDKQEIVQENREISVSLED
ncbi:DNA-packaging protein [Clostridium sp. LY3-2]|uniref:DNA-packaging protein n=1 Tax=unclassified Clostridium TaxID=2614128 RepID=UPI0021535C4E|nr:DNA-packaging protein [Clostridium sp. LY3-2]MCR6516312.1 DNA-packaging protein [Clostridium sp. LY3-2]